VVHHLGLATRTQISVCKSPFPSAGTAVSHITEQMQQNTDVTKLRAAFDSGMRHCAQCEHGFNHYSIYSKIKPQYPYSYVYGTNNWHYETGHPRTDFSDNQTRLDLSCSLV